MRPRIPELRDTVVQTASPEDRKFRNFQRDRTVFREDGKDWMVHEISWSSHCSEVTKVTLFEVFMLEDDR